MCDHLFPLLFPKHSETLKFLDIPIQEVGAKRRLNSTSKVTRGQHFGNPTLGSGGKKTFKRYLKSEQTYKQTDRQTNRRTHRRTNRLIENIKDVWTIIMGEEGCALCMSSPTSCTIGRKLCWMLDVRE